MLRDMMLYRLPEPMVSARWRRSLVARLTCAFPKEDVWAQLSGGTIPTSVPIILRSAGLGGLYPESLCRNEKGDFLLPASLILAIDRDELFIEILRLPAHQHGRSTIGSTWYPTWWMRCKEDRESLLFTAKMLYKKAVAAEEAA